jgi:ABC-2 type transport system ATP-binding protein
MSKSAITLEGVHRYFGFLHAVRDISFSIEAGQVVGFIGANGAGKTTTMRMMCSLDRPDRGTIKIGGYDVVSHPLQVKSLIGWMPDAFGTYTNMTVWEYLDFFARAYGYQGKERGKRVDEVMHFTELTPLASRPMDTLSKGMSQRLCLGRTLVHDPDILVLDEPAAGLDPKARVEFKHLIRLLAAEGKTIFISSHILSELGEMCDSMIFIDHGTLIHHGSADSLLQDHEPGQLVSIQVADQIEQLENWISMQPGINKIESRKRGVLVRLESEDPAELTATLKRMLQADLPVVGFAKEETKLEDAFISLLNKQQTLPLNPPPLPPKLTPPVQST